LKACKTSKKRLFNQNDRCYLSVEIDVHLFEGDRREILSGRLLRIVAVVQQVEQILHDPDHLLLRDRSVAVDVEYPEDLLQVGFRRSVGHDVEDDHELPEVDVPVPVGVVHSEDVLLQLLSVRVGVAGLHHVPEIFLPDFSVRMFSQKIFVLKLN